jgi:hypothetical protein
MNTVVFMRKLSYAARAAHVDSSTKAQFFNAKTNKSNVSGDVLASSFPQPGGALEWAGKSFISWAAFHLWFKTSKQYENAIALAEGLMLGKGAVPAGGPLQTFRLLRIAADQMYGRYPAKFPAALPPWEPLRVGVWDELECERLRAAVAGELEHVRTEGGPINWRRVAACVRTRDAKKCNKRANADTI